MARYRDAIAWIAWNDDNEWLEDVDYGHPSVTLSLVADLFNKTVEQATEDLRTELARHENRS